MKYKIVASDEADEFEKHINLELSDGWILQGGVSVAIHSGENGYFWYVQAMTKSEE